MLTVFAAHGLPEIVAGDDLAALTGDPLDGVLEEGDILAVASKIVSTAERRANRRGNAAIALPGMWGL